jgi:hypothetical protein
MQTDHIALGVDSKRDEPQILHRLANHSVVLIAASYSKNRFKAESFESVV